MEYQTGMLVESRAGHDKGELYIISGITDGYVDVYKRQALRLATHKLPVKCKVVSRAELEGGENSEN